MNNDASFQRLAAVTSILAALMAFGSIGFQAAVLGVTTDPFSNPTCAGYMRHPLKKSLFDNDDYAFQAPFVRTDVLSSQ